MHGGASPNTGVEMTFPLTGGFADSPCAGRIFSSARLLDIEIEQICTFDQDNGVSPALVLFTLNPANYSAHPLAFMRT